VPARDQAHQPMAREPDHWATASFQRLSSTATITRCRCLRRRITPQAPRHTCSSGIASAGLPKLASLERDTALAAPLDRACAAALSRSRSQRTTTGTTGAHSQDLGVEECTARRAGLCDRRSHCRPARSRFAVWFHVKRGAWVLSGPALSAGRGEIVAMCVRL
jgi:hypothetical protein